MLRKIKMKKTKDNQKQKNHPDCKFFYRTIPDVEGFDIFLEISKIRNYITQSNEEKLKSRFAKELLSYVSNISKPLKHIRYFVKKNTTYIVKHEKYAIKNKTNKNWKRTWNNV